MYDNAFALAQVELKSSHTISLVLNPNRTVYLAPSDCAGKTRAHLPLEEVYPPRNERHL